jgi:hypothetical protein
VRGRAGIRKALYKIEDVDALINHFEETSPKFDQLAKAIAEFRTAIVRNGRFIPSCDEHWRSGEAMTTGFVESTGNVAMRTRFCEKQHMQWPRKSSGQRIRQFFVLSTTTASVVLPPRDPTGLSS